MAESLIDRLEALIEQAKDQEPSDYELWRETARATLIDYYGSYDHPEVSRFIRTLVPGIVMSDYTIASGEFAEAMRQAIREGVVILQVLAASLGSRRTDTQSEKHDDALAGRSVFLVHGRDQPAITAMKQLLRALDLKVVDWEEAVAAVGEPNPFVGDVVEAGLRIADAVVVLFTPDDVVRLRPDLLTLHDGPNERNDLGQARPNVIFEAGYAQALAKQRCVMAAVRPVKLHSDIGGRHVVYLDETAESRHRFAHRLRLAGLEVSDDGTDWLSAGKFPDYTPLIGHPEAVSETVELPPGVEDDPPGFLEILADMEDANPRLVEAIESIGREVQLMGDLAGTATERVYESDARGAGTRGRLAIALEYADSLKGPAERLDEMVANYEQDLGAVSAGFEYLMGRIESAEDLDDEESAAAQQFVSTVIDLGNSTRGAMDSLTGLLASLEQVGAMARPVRQQTTRIRRALERFSDASSKILTWADRAVHTEFADGT